MLTLNLFKHLLFILQQRRAGDRVSFSAHLKGHEKIALAHGRKIHADASMDDLRSPSLRFGDKVTLNRYAYMQGCAGGVRLGEQVEINNHRIIDGTAVTIGAGAVVREDVPAYAVVAGMPATIKKYRE